MFELFRRAFLRDPGRLGDSASPELKQETPGLTELFRQFGGSSFCNGLYRIIDPSDTSVWKRRLSVGFPEFADRVACFGFDWSGTIFAINCQQLTSSDADIFMFEPGTGQALRTAGSLEIFHEKTLLASAESTLSKAFFQSWLESGGKPPSLSQCIGYKQPLFLGGRDEVSNLELCDIDVYWHLNGQLISHVKHLPEGTTIRLKIGDLH